MFLSQPSGEAHAMKAPACSEPNGETAQGGCRCQAMPVGGSTGMETSSSPGVDYISGMKWKSVSPRRVCR